MSKSPKGKPSVVPINENSSKLLTKVRSLDEIRPYFLLVDDDYDFAQFIERVLAKSYLLDYAPDGYTAFQMLFQNDYQLVLCDINMPYIGGLTLLEEMHSRNIKIPLIFISGYIDEETTREALRKGAYNVVEKPFQMDELVQKIEMAIQLDSNNQIESVEDQERAHVYNRLKTYYYDIQNLLYFIKFHNISLSEVMKELDIKERTGKCIFDDVRNLIVKKSA